jgi:hypothetical protein
VTTSVGPSSAPLSTPSGALVLRVWWEAKSAEPFRARVLAVEPDGRTSELGTVADLSEAITLIRNWMNEFVIKAADSHTVTVDTQLPHPPP